MLKYCENKECINHCGVDVDGRKQKCELCGNTLSKIEPAEIVDKAKNEPEKQTEPTEKPTPKIISGSKNTHIVGG